MCLYFITYNTQKRVVPASTMVHFSKIQALRLNIVLMSVLFLFPINRLILVAILILTKIKYTRIEQRCTRTRITHAKRILRFIIFPFTHRTCVRACVRVGAPARVSPFLLMCMRVYIRTVKQTRFESLSGFNFGNWARVEILSVYQCALCPCSCSCPCPFGWVRA